MNKEYDYKAHSELLSKYNDIKRKELSYMVFTLSNYNDIERLGSILMTFFKKMNKRYRASRVDFLCVLESSSSLTKSLSLSELIYKDKLKDIGLHLHLFITNIERLYESFRYNLFDMIWSKIIPQRQIKSTNISINVLNEIKMYSPQRFIEYHTKQFIGNRNGLFIVDNIS